MLSPLERLEERYERFMASPEIGTPDYRARKTELIERRYNQLTRAPTHRPRERNKYTGEILRRIRARNGVGRPSKT